MAVSPNILICDDDPVVHESLSLYLDNDNFSHADAYDGKESLEMAHATKPDLILLDVTELAAHRIDLILLLAYDRSEYLIELRKIYVPDKLFVIDRLDIFKYFLGKRRSLVDIPDRIDLPVLEFE